MKLGLLLLISTWVVIALAWFFPRAFKIAGAALYALGDASENIRSTFGRKFARYQRKGIHVAIREPESSLRLTPVQEDVLQALIAQGSPRGKAKASVDRAITALPATATFDELWRKAVA